MAETTFEGVDEVRAAVGTHLGWSPWITVTQEQIDRFTEATGHDDLTYLALSLTNLFLPQVVEVRGVSLGVNRGTGSIRYPTTIEAGARLRGGVALVAVDDVPAKDGSGTAGVDTTMVITVERESDDPVCVVESLSRYLA